mgnify:CR=1 FL=1
MGIFSKIFGGAKELTRIANGVANITNLLDQYETDDDLTYLYISAWICRISVLDIVEHNQFPMTYKLYAPIRGHQHHIMLTEAYMLTLTRIMSKAQERGSRVEHYVQDIIDKGDVLCRFYSS